MTGGGASAGDSVEPSLRVKQYLKKYKSFLLESITTNFMKMLCYFDITIIHSRWNINNNILIDI